MLFGYEMKKIWRRVSPLLVLIVLAVTAVATVTITAIFFNRTPTAQADVSTQYAALESKIKNWNDTLDRSAFATTFDKFYNDYKTMNASTLYDLDKLVDNYNTAKTSFANFYWDYYRHYIYDNNQHIDDYLLVRANYIDKFDEILLQLDSFFDITEPTNDKIITALKTTNTAWEDATLQTILDNLFFVQKITNEDLTVLQTFFNEHPANQPTVNYNTAYDYALNRYWLAISASSTYVGNLSEYTGFSDYQDVTTSTRACQLAEYRLTHGDEDYAAPFAFGNIFNNSSQVSLFDFIFTNMEMAMLPMALLVMIWAACTFFTDNYQRTMIATVAAGKKRSTIILTKMSVILTLTAVGLLLLTGIYAVSGVLFFKAYVSPDILFLFNGTKAMTMSAINYFAIYFLDLIFKLLPLIAVCGLFSFAKNKPFVIVSLTTLICIIVVALNACLGGFAFYQFVPLMGLDPLRYFGAHLLLAPMPVTYNIWYTFPAMFAITVILYWILIHTFRRHDF